MTPTTPHAQSVQIDPTLKSLVETARRDIDQFWARTIRNYVPPVDVIAVQSPTHTECGAFEKPNAQYCWPANKIYWDVSLFTQQFAIGDFAPVFILAHEWGHLVQRQLGFRRSELGLLNIQLELQADCFAGEYAADAKTRGVVEPGDDDEAVLSLRRAGDKLNYPWFDSRAHGTPGHRIDAFSYGFEGGDCAVDAFFEFLKDRGVDPARVPQTPAPESGSLAANLPQQAGRFTLGEVTRKQLPDAIDTLVADYRTPDGISVVLAIASTASEERSRLGVVENLRILIERGYREVKRANIAETNTGAPLGVMIITRGQDEVVVWSNRRIVALARGPFDVATELYNALPF